MSWKYMSFDSICEFQSGLWTGKKPPFVSVKVIRNTNFTKDCQLNTNDIVQLDVEVSQFLKRELAYGDLILEKSGGGPKQAVGRVIKFDKKDKGYSVSNFTSIIRIKNKDIIGFEYLHKFLYFFYVSGQTLPLQNNSTGIRNLNNKAYQKIEIPIPPLSEQQQIVEKLDTAFDLIDRAKANIEKNIQNAKELFQSKLNQVFSEKGEGWEEKSLHKVAKIINGFAFSSSDFSKENEIKSIKITNVGVNTFVDDVDNYLPLKLLEKNSAVCVNAGDIVIALTRTIIAAGLKVAVVPQHYNNSLLNQRVAAIKENGSLSNKYLYYFLSSSICKEYVLNHVNTLMQPNLSINDLKEMPVPFPSLEEQSIIVSLFEQLSAQTELLQQKYQQKLANLEELKKSILEKAFKGELI